MVKSVARLIQKVLSGQKIVTDPSKCKLIRARGLDHRGTCFGSDTFSFFYIIRRFNRFSFLSSHKDSGSVFNLHLLRVTHKKKSNCESEFEHKSIACSTESRSTRVRFAFLSCKKKEKIQYRLRRNEGISGILIKRRRLRSRVKLPRFSTFFDHDRRGKSSLIS